MQEAVENGGVNADLDFVIEMNNLAKQPQMHVPLLLSPLLPLDEKQVPLLTGDSVLIIEQDENTKEFAPRASPSESVWLKRKSKSKRRGCPGER